MKMKNFALLISILLCLGCATTNFSNDDYLTTDVQERLEENPITSGFNFGVVVENSVVYLRGSAPPNNNIRSVAVATALNTPGVVEVIDKLYPPTDGRY